MQTSLFIRIVVGLAAGLGVAAVDNFAFAGEVSPIVIVGMLLIVAGAFGTVWGSRAAIAAIVVWTCLPIAHVVKRVFGLPDTLHPNTYASILKLAIFSLVVTAVGFGLGLVLHRLIARKAQQNA